MKYKITLNDSIDLIVDANSEVEAVRAAKNVKDAMRARLADESTAEKAHDSDDVEVHDSDQLRKLAYDLAQMGNYFDRANSAHSRSLLSANDKQKLTEFFNLGMKVYEVMKKEVEGMRQAKAAGTLKERRSWDWTDTQKLLSDAIERMYWTREPKLAALSKRLGDLWDEYRNLIHD